MRVAIGLACLLLLVACGSGPEAEPEQAADATVSEVSFVDPIAAELEGIESPESKVVRPQLREATPEEVRRKLDYRRPFNDEDIDYWLAAKLEMWDIVIEATKDDDDWAEYQKNKRAIAEELGLTSLRYISIDERMGRAHRYMRTDDETPPQAVRDVELLRKHEARITESFKQARNVTEHLFKRYQIEKTKAEELAAEQAGQP